MDAQTQNPLSVLLVNQRDVPRALWPDWRMLTPAGKVQALIDYNNATGRLDAAGARKAVKQRKQRAQAIRFHRAMRTPVRLTRLAISRGLRGPSLGVKVGTSRDGKLVYVIRAGRTARKGFAAEYWEPTSVPGGGNV